MDCLDKEVKVRVCPFKDLKIGDKVLFSRWAVTIKDIDTNRHEPKILAVDDDGLPYTLEKYFVYYKLVA